MSAKINSKTIRYACPLSENAGRLGFYHIGTYYLEVSGKTVAAAQETKQLKRIGDTDYPDIPWDNSTF